MSYHFSKRISGSFDEVITRITEELSKEGFGLLTQIDVQATLKKKLGIDFRRYLILGACNPPFAYKALVTEPKIGLMLPCNVIVDEASPDSIEVSAIDPVASMAAVENPDLRSIANEIREKLKRVIEAL